MSDDFIKDTRSAQSIDWTPEKLTAFKQAYEAVKDKGRDHTFDFEGHVFLVGYAFYLIQYLDGEFAKHERR